MEWQDKGKEAVTTALAIAPVPIAEQYVDPQLAQRGYFPGNDFSKYLGLGGGGVLTLAVLFDLFKKDPELEERLLRIGYAWIMQGGFKHMRDTQSTAYYPGYRYPGVRPPNAPPPSQNYGAGAINIDGETIKFRGGR